ncbi:hypothetical protein S7335_3523 [Synechococcus sp. PCC 7335]|nr:hypothetical protein S7335_3523 [Synechococcus sp. PCC 7335]
MCLLAKSLNVPDFFKKNYASKQCFFSRVVQVLWVFGFNAARCGFG